jgi:hypothetical protein
MLVRYNIIRKKTGTYGSLYEPPFTGTYGSLYEPPLEMPTRWVGITTRKFQVFCRWVLPFGHLKRPLGTLPHGM